jgi:anti-sigma factor RsiW
MTCQELVELVTDYLDGALPPDAAARFEAHVAACEGCAVHLEQVRTTIAITRASGHSVEPATVSPLLDAFRDWHALRRDPRRS